MRHQRAPLVVILAVAIGLSAIPAAPLAAADEPIYYLPAPGGTELIVRGDNGRADGRTAEQRYAFDFIAAEDTRALPGGGGAWRHRHRPAGRCQRRTLQRPARRTAASLLA